jgi:hypothetical protein
MFSDRIRARHRLWWDDVPKDAAAREHRARDMYVAAHRDDPEADWRCCPLWQRRLSNKLSAREFAVKHGCRVPELYWSGLEVDQVPLQSLPEHFVIRPARGHSSIGVYLMAGETELMDGVPRTRAALRRDLERQFGRVVRAPLMVEEFITDERGAYRIPTDYHCHVFGSRIGAIEVSPRTGRGPFGSRRNFYTEAWQPLPEPMYTDRLPYGGNYDPPACLDEMLDHARVLGTAYGTYVRIDFYASRAGCVFGEFSPTPAKGDFFSPFADRYFERIWRETFSEPAA